MAKERDGNQCVAILSVTIQPTAVAAPTKARPPTRSPAHHPATRPRSTQQQHQHVPPAHPLPHSATFVEAEDAVIRYTGMPVTYGIAVNYRFQ